MSERDIRRVAAEADCDPRSVRRYLRNEMIRPTVRARIERAIKKLRLSHAG